MKKSKKILFLLIISSMLFQFGCVTSLFLEKIEDINGPYWHAVKEKLGEDTDISKIEKIIEEKIDQIYTPKLYHVSVNHEKVNDKNIFSHSSLVTSFKENGNWRYWQNDAENKVTTEILVIKKQHKIFVYLQTETLKHCYAGYPLYLFTPVTMSIDLVFLPINIYYILVISSFPRLG